VERGPENGVGTIQEKPGKRSLLPSPLISFFRKLLPRGWIEDDGDRRSHSRYVRLWRATVLLTGGVSIAPLIIIGALDFYQDQRAIKDQIARPLLWLTSNAKLSTEYSLEERTSAINYLIHDKSFAELSNQEKLGRVFKNLKSSFGGFVDLGLIDSTGKQRAYVGPYKLHGKDYKDQVWFHEVMLRGMHVSEVFMGYRNFPHFVIAIKDEPTDGDFYILRATIDTEILNRNIPSLGPGPSIDAFIINRQGVLQTPSRFYGDVMGIAPIPIPPYSKNPEFDELRDSAGNSYVMGYAYIEKSPFICVIMRESGALMGNWFTLRAKRLGFLAASVTAILALIMGTSSYFVSRIRNADLRQAKALHSIEYTNKMASIGRLAAGVAHEVNNPLAVIGEKAGLAKDILSLSDDFPQKEKFLKLTESIQNSVKRCSSITHRLLGFAKQVQTKTETIDLRLFITEVMSFLEKEISYRNIEIKMLIPEDLPSIKSDRGQLQQIFLNILNNAIEELENGGKIDISIQERHGGMVALTVADNGRGIAEEDLKNIFEPFFTTKMEFGTGLGLSITYGIIQKLGGSIDVSSAVGQGTSFTVTLPI